MYKICVTSDETKTILDIIDIDTRPNTGWSINYSHLFNERISGHMPLNDAQQIQYAIKFYRENHYKFRDGTPL